MLMCSWFESHSAVSSHNGRFHRTGNFPQPRGEEHVENQKRGIPTKVWVSSSKHSTRDCKQGNYPPKVLNKDPNAKAYKVGALHPHRIVCVFFEGTLLGVASNGRHRKAIICWGPFALKHPPTCCCFLIGSKPPV